MNQVSYLAQTYVNSGFFDPDGGFSLLNEPREELLNVVFQLRRVGEDAVTSEEMTLTQQHLEEPPQQFRKI